MGVTISSRVRAAIMADAAATPDVEICGLLLGTAATIDAAVPCGNVAPEPARSFEIDPAALFAAHRRARGGGPAIIGHYHSHPSGLAVPSTRDAAQAMGDGAVWLIVAGGMARAWRSVETHAFVEEPLHVIA